MRFWRTQRLPLLLAAVLTAANAAKPPVVDDAAYIFFARHLALHPLDPYGFELFWYAEPQPAMDILLPPLLPYWLAAGIGVFGENPFLLKLWLFPFAWLLTAAAGSLLRRFAGQVAVPGLVLFTLSPAVLPLFNFMLDVPALALGLSAIAVFVRGCDRKSLWRVTLAGALCGLAMQTKYSALVTPAVIVWYGIVRGWRGAAFLAVGVIVAISLFGGWEAFVFARHGESHFLHHLRDGGDGRGFWSSVAVKLHDGVAGTGQFGGLTIGLALWLMRSVGVPRWAHIALTALAAIGIGVVCVLPSRYAPVHIDATSGLITGEIAHVVFPALGVVTLLTLVVAEVRLVWRGERFRISPAVKFLIGWMVLEFAGSVALSPFPAARREVGLTAAIAVFAAAAVARFGRVGTRPTPPRWALAAGVGWGLLLAALDCWDAYPEPVLAARAAAVVHRADGETVWFNGHWGFQYACDRAGMAPVVPGRSVLKAGDWLVYPQLPDEVGFYRPHHGGASFRIDPARTAKVEEFVWEDWVAAQSLPHLYGGSVPVRSRNHPRLKVVVYRVTADWAP